MPLGKSVKVLGRRSLVPRALKDVFAGRVPCELVEHLNLQDGACFERLQAVSVKVSDLREDRRLLDYLTDVARPALTSRRLDQTAPAFPVGVDSSISFDRLPLHTRTRNCLRKEGLLSAKALRRQSLGQLLAIPAFGVGSLLDLLTAVEGSGRASKRPFDDKAVPERPEKRPTLMPQLTREARRLGAQAWAREVSLFDVRLGTALFKDEQSLAEVERALEADSVPLEEPLCPEPPQWDPVLLRCPLRTRTWNRLAELGLVRLSSLWSLTVREVLNLPGLGGRTLVDLLTVLDVCRLAASMPAFNDRDPTLADFCEAVVNRAADPRFPECVAERIHQTRTLGVRCLSLSLEQELRELAESSCKSPDRALEYLGWDGRGPRTLQAVGTPRGLSRERVRQAVAGLMARLAAAPAWTPTLRRAQEACGRWCPRPADEIAQLLQLHGLAAAPFHPYGLITATDILKPRPALSLGRLDNTAWVFGTEELRLRKTIKLARAACARSGACSLTYLQRALTKKSRLPEDTLREWLGRLPGVHWLDRDRNWFRFMSRSSAVERTLWKIMAVAPTIQLSELRIGLTRYPRLVSVPPLAVLRELCRAVGLRVDGDTVRVARPACPETVLSQTEFVLFDILRAHGPLLPVSELTPRCLQRGVRESTLVKYLSTSPILSRHAVGVYGLCGAQSEVDLPQVTGN